MNDRYEVLGRFYDDEKGEMVRVRFPGGKVYEYKYRTMDDVREMLKNGGRICLDKCYIKDFEYEQLFDSKVEIQPVIKVFSSKNAFFDCDVNFTKSIIKGKANFTNAIFKGDTSFFDITFSKEIDFSDCTFSKEVIFSDISSKNEAKFVGVSFNGEATFNNIFFNGRVSFINTEFNNNIGFNFTTFNEKAYISAESRGVIRFFDCSFKDELSLDIRNTKFLYFDSCTNYGLIDIQDEPTEIEGLAFKNMNNLGHINLNWDFYKDYLKEIEVEERDEDGHFRFVKTNDHCAGQFKMLKENFHNLGDYDAEDEAYVEYKRAQRKEQKGIRKAFSFLFDKIGRYGTDPIRVLITMLIVIFAFGLIYCGFLGDLAFSNEVKSVWLIEFVKDPDLKDLIPGIFKIKWEDLFCFIKNGGLLDILNIIIKPFYFSMVTFFTVGYGDIYPITSLTEILVCIESFCGVFLMSFFSVALVRKILR